MYVDIYMLHLQLCWAERYLVPRAAERWPVASQGDAQLSAGHEVGKQSVAILVMGEKIK